MSNNRILGTVAFNAFYEGLESREPLPPRSFDNSPVEAQDRWQRAGEAVAKSLRLSDDTDKQGEVNYITIREPDNITLNAVERVLQLAERMLQQDRASLSGPQITLEMVRDIPLDEEAIDEVNNFFGALALGKERRG